MSLSTPVLIVGAGPVGLCMALGLARAGIECLLVEKHPSTTNHPKARGINIRSMEIFRLWGLEKAMRKHQLPREAHRFIWLETLQGAEITRVSAEARPQTLSPTTSALISQDWVEQELLQAIKHYPQVRYQFNTHATLVNSNKNSVTVSLKNTKTGDETLVTTQYLIAADGAASPIRNGLSIGMQGQDNLGEFCNIYCEMDISRYVKDRISVGFIFTHAEHPGTFLLSKDGHKRWLVGIRYDNKSGILRDQFTDEFCLSYVARLINDPSVSIKLINKAFWTMAALIAENYRADRIFFVGDSAHRLPPTGGLGMNTGVQDAHNLVWKLAAVLKGEAQETLLDSYYTERAPIAAANIAWSTKNAHRFNRIFEALYKKDYKTMTEALNEQSEHLNQVSLDLGFCYTEGALLPEPESHSPSSGNTYVPTTIPGSRAPHYPLWQNGHLISTLDLFTTHFVLLSPAANNSWHQAARDLPIKSYRIGVNGELEDREGQWQTLYQISPNGAVLIRPDGHVAWRSINGVDDPHKKCREVLAALDL